MASMLDDLDIPTARGRAWGTSSVHRLVEKARAQGRRDMNEQATEWLEWFAWRPIKACGRWRWLTVVERRRDAHLGVTGSYLVDEWPWEYRAGSSHDYPDGDLQYPAHFTIHTCRHCGERFTI